MRDLHQRQDMITLSNSEPNSNLKWSLNAGAYLEQNHCIVKSSCQKLADLLIPVSLSEAITEASSESLVSEPVESNVGIQSHMMVFGCTNGISTRMGVDEILQAPIYKRKEAVTQRMPSANCTMGAADHPCNLGSIGHPEFCNRPCMFFPDGQCSVGDSCNFCHLIHPRKFLNLDKINRCTLKALPNADRKCLLLAAMKERAAKALPEEKLIEFLQLLRDVFGSSGPVLAPVNEGWRDGRLFNQLRKMPLISLFYLLQDSNSIVDKLTAREAMNKFRLSLAD